MEELNLVDLFNYFIKKFSTIVIITIITLIVGLCYLFLIKQPLFKGETTLILVQDNAPVTQSDLSFYRNLVPTYTKIIKSKKVITDAINNLKLDMNYEDLINKITVSSEDETEMIKITVSDVDPSFAASVANSLAYSFKNEIVNIYNLENVYVFEKAEIEENPYNIHNLRDIVIFTLVGFVIALASVFVIYYFDTSIKSSEELEDKLKLIVLGNIPMYKRRKSE